MTREEEIVKASKVYSEYEYNQTDYENGFLKGAKWADEHPINVWHDVIEPPKLGEWFLAQIGNIVFDTFIMDMNKNEDWKNWSNGINIKRWAYISDLLPKGGEK